LSKFLSKLSADGLLTTLDYASSSNCLVINLQASCNDDLTYLL